MPKEKILKEGSIDIEMIAETDLEIPEHKGKYDWESVEKALKEGKAFIFSIDAKKNSILTGIRRLAEEKKIPMPKLATYTPTKQFILIPPKQS